MYARFPNVQRQAGFASGYESLSLQWSPQDRDDHNGSVEVWNVLKWLGFVD